MGGSGLPCACNTRVNAEEIDIPRIRTEFLKQAVLWVCELAARDRLEARDPAGELRRYFESVCIAFLLMRGTSFPNKLTTSAGDYPSSKLLGGFPEAGRGYENFY